MGIRYGFNIQDSVRLALMTGRPRPDSGGGVGLTAPPESKQKRIAGMAGALGQVGIGIELPGAAGTVLPPACPCLPYRSVSVGAMVTTTLGYD